MATQEKHTVWNASTMDAETGETWIIELHGVVHPQSSCWRLDEPFHLGFPDSEWTIVMSDSKFRVLARGPSPNDLATYRNEVMSVVRGVLDAIGFHLGAVLTPELHGFVAFPVNGSAGLLGAPAVAWHELTGRDPVTALRVDATDLGPFMRAAAGDSLIRCALSDLSMAIDRPDDTGFYAYRAVESARQYFRKPADGDEQDVPWARLHEALGYTKEDLVPLAHAARPRRHGDLQLITEAQRLESLRIARDVIARLVTHHLASLEESTEEPAKPD
jgi:hypothetical protein